MNNNLVTLSSNFDPSAIDRSEYTYSLAREAVRCGIISEADFERIKNDLLVALSDVINLYTGNESSSVKINTAEKLSRSLVYNIDTYLLSLSDDSRAIESLKSRRMTELYGKGYLINSNLYNKAKVLYEKARYSRLKNACEEYNKTLDVYLRNYLLSYNPIFSSDAKLFLSLSEYALDGVYHIDGTVRVLEQIIALNSGTESDYYMSVSDAEDSLS